MILLSLINREYRKQWSTSGPWLSIIISSLIISPHLFDVYNKGLTTFLFALRHDNPQITELIRRIAELIINISLYNFAFFISIGFIIGYQNLYSSIKIWFSKLRHSPFDIFILISALGPVTIIFLATFFGVRPRIQWLVPTSISFIAVWARICLEAKLEYSFRSVFRPYMIMLIFVLGLYMANRYADAAFNPRPLYAEMDDRRLAEIVKEKWSLVSKNKIDYIVSLGGQHGRQVAGSVKFVLDYPIHILENNSLKSSPWIDLEDLKQKGAIILAPHGIPADTLVAGRKIELIERIKRPMLRGGTYPYEFDIGIVPPLN